MKLPQETQDKMTEFRVACEMLEYSIAFWWGEKRALKYAELKTRLREEIQDSIETLYPQLRDKPYHWKRVVGEYQVFEGDS